MGNAIHFAKSVVALLLVYSGALWIWMRCRKPSVLVLAYHRVTPDVELGACAFPAMHVSVSSFEKQLLALRARYRLIAKSELLDLLGSPAALRQHVAVITFDDGYRDNYHHAFPVLVHNNVPATFFLSLGFVDRRQPFWFDRLAAAFVGLDQRPFQDRVAWPEPVRSAFTSGVPAVERLGQLAAFLKTLEDSQRLQWIEALETELGAAAKPAVEALTWQEVEEMQQRGMTFGAHGVSHAILTTLARESVRRELADSIAGVGLRIGRPVDAVAYPNGNATTDVAHLARHAGAALGFTMERRANRPGDDVLRLGRYNVCEATSRSAFRTFSRAYFWCEITGLFDLLLRRRARWGDTRA